LLKKKKDTVASQNTSVAYATLSLNICLFLWLLSTCQPEKCFSCNLYQSNPENSRRYPKSNQCLNQKTMENSNLLLSLHEMPVSI